MCTKGRGGVLSSGDYCAPRQRMPGSVDSPLVANQTPVKLFKRV